jgi:hypothetical protein
MITIQSIVWLCYVRLRPRLKLKHSCKQEPPSDWMSFHSCTSHLRCPTLSLLVRQQHITHAEVTVAIVMK